MVSLRVSERSCWIFPRLNPGETVSGDTGDRINLPPTVRRPPDTLKSSILDLRRAELNGAHEKIAKSHMYMITNW